MTAIVWEHSGKIYISVKDENHTPLTSGMSVAYARELRDELTKVIDKNLKAKIVITRFNNSIEEHQMEFAYTAATKKNMQNVAFQMFDLFTRNLNATRVEMEIHEQRLVHFWERTCSSAANGEDSPRKPQDRLAGRVVAPG